MMFISLPWFAVVAYWIGFAICWRSLTGHVAWSTHLTAKTNQTVKPPVENWLVASLPCAAVSLLWPAVLLFAIRWPWVKGAEKEAIVKLGEIWHHQLLAENRKYEEIAEQSWDEQFKNLKGEVVDEPEAQAGLSPYHEWDKHRAEWRNR